MNAAPPQESAPTPVSNFLRQIIAEDLRTHKYGGRVVTRFPPEPNGYLHIGHAKSICLNFGLAAENGGTCHLRFDDTNPVKEDVEFTDSIMAAVKWLGFDWGPHLYHASDYFDRLYEFARHLIKAGLAYVDSSTPEEVRRLRGTLTEPGKPGPYRDRSVEENLDLFRRMKEGEFPDGAHVLRLKIDLASPNMNLRDPAIYRIRHTTHHRTGDKWCVYPLYDYTHCISDALERITHSICTLEFQDHRPLYDWVIERLAEAGLLQRPLPQQYEFARLNLTYTVMSKRKLIELVEGNHVDGWDDPRMPTLVGLRRRGYTPESIRLFAERIGVSKAHQWIDISVLEMCLRDDLNERAERRTAVLDPLKLIIDNYPADGEEECFAPESSAEARARQAFDAADAGTVDRTRRLQRTTAEGLFPTVARRGGAPALRLHHQVRRRRQGRGGQRRRGALHVRPRHAQRYRRRRSAQGQGEHPLAVCCARPAR